MTADNQVTEVTVLFLYIEAIYDVFCTLGWLTDPIKSTAKIIVSGLLHTIEK